MELHAEHGRKEDIHFDLQLNFEIEFGWKLSVSWMILGSIKFYEHVELLLKFKFLMQY